MSASTPRQLLLGGGRNFRDLGGYLAEDGRRVRWRQVFRSGVMSYLTTEDGAELAALGIRASCDFRDSEERSREPTPWPQGVRQLTWDHVRGSLGMRKRLEGRELDAPFAKATMIAFYRRLPYRFVTHFSDMLRALAEGSVPLVINCAAGKDRTGMAAAIILASLGVSREQILADYALTDTAVDLERELFEHPRTSVGFGADREMIARVTAEARAPLLRADPDYLEAALAQIESEEGSVEAFVREKLGLSDGLRGKLRNQLLEG